MKRLVRVGTFGMKLEVQNGNKWTLKQSSDKWNWNILGNVFELLMKHLLSL